MTTVDQLIRLQLAEERVQAIKNVISVTFNRLEKLRIKALADDDAYTAELADVRQEFLTILAVGFGFDPPTVIEDDL